MTTKTISPELRAFLQNWLDWVERGAPEGEPYARSCGLCTNLGWSEFANLKVWAELQSVLPYGGRRSYPFGARGYTERVAHGTQHECPKRLAWVRKTLAEAASEEG